MELHAVYHRNQNVKNSNSKYTDRRKKSQIALNVADLQHSYVLSTETFCLMRFAPKKLESSTQESRSDKIFEKI